MAKTARDFVYDGLELVPGPLSEFVEAQLQASISGHWQSQVKERQPSIRIENGKFKWDQQALLNVMNKLWNDAFKDVLSRTERAIINELIEVRNAHAHGEHFSYPDAERALDSMRRLMEAIDATNETQKLENLRSSILRVRFTEQQRSKERSTKSQTGQLGFNIPAGLKPWRDVVQPHEDVATGNFTQAEFAADLSKVHDGSAKDEYSEPKQFFARTFLTQGLSDLIKNSVKRLRGEGGDPVIELQTNFGGGKTHSMLALYHMVGDTNLQNLPGLDQLLPNIEFDKKVKRAVIVGTARGPSDAYEPEIGVKIYTTWGEMAYQLGGKEAYKLVQEQDISREAPGSGVITKLLTSCSPCLILIDEWVAYLRQIYSTNSSPAGTFDQNLSFVQSLTEGIKVVKGALLVASLPASQIEVGGEGGQEALNKLKNTFSRVHASWLPASAEESYEIVRRRLFNDVSGESGPDKDNTIKQFMRMYDADKDSFIQGASNDEYRKRLEISYPIHPELFDQFYNSWSSVERFQRTRGILRLMAQVIHELWVSNDTSIMIMPGGIPVGVQEVSPELTKYLEHGWPAIISSDIDGSQSLPMRIDTDVPSLGQVSATRRVARALFMATAPLSGSQNPGIDRKRINMAVAQPGDVTIRFSDALHRLSGIATFLHTDNNTYWYATNPSLNKMATERAAQIDANLIAETIDNSLRELVQKDSSSKQFEAIHIAPSSSADVIDELSGCRVVLLGIKHPHSTNNKNSEAMIEVKDIIAHRGHAPRVYKNVLIFLAGDKSSIDNVDEAARRYLSWQQIFDEKERFNLRPDEANTAERNAINEKQIFLTRLKEAWHWMIHPFQVSADKDIEFASSKVSAQDQLFEKMKRNMVRDEIVFDQLGPERLQRELTKYIWQNNDHLKTSDIRDYCSKFIYLPRMLSQNVLQNTILSAISQIVPGTFGYAEALDESQKKYLGLVVDNGMNTQVLINSESLIVQKDIALRQMENKTDASRKDNDEEQSELVTKVDEEEIIVVKKSYRGSVKISTQSPAKDFGTIIENIVEQLTSIIDAEVDLTLEISAEVPNGIDKNKERTLMENSNTLRFIDSSIN